MDTGSSLFASVIEDHLELKRRNARLDKDLPLNEFSGSDPFENHPLFKTEEQARLEDTMEGIESPEVVAVASPLGWPGEDAAVGEETEDGLWSRSRDFDWGD